MTAKKKRKKVKYKTISFQLTSKQKKSLTNYCKARKTTPTKLIKRMIRKYIDKYATEVPKDYYVTENQLDLFEEEIEEGKIEN